MKIGFIINSETTLAAWEFEMLKQVKKELPSTEIVFIIYPAKTIKPYLKEPFLLSLFKKMERIWFRSLPNAFKQLPVPDILHELKAELIGFSGLHKQSIDVLYAPPEIASDLSCISFAKFGIWTIRFSCDDPSLNGFWEVMNNKPTIKSLLTVKLSDSNEWITVYEGTTTPVVFSVRNTLITLAWKSSSFLAYRLKELSVSDSDIFFRQYADKTVKNYPVKKDQLNNFYIFFLTIRNLKRYLSYKIRNKIESKKFTILYSFQDTNLLNIEFKNFKSLSSPAGSFWADPFVVKLQNEYFIFFEEFSHKKNKGHISVVKIDPARNFSDAISVLSKDHHLSYPFIFKWQDHHYMVPESASKRTVELYRATSFPYQWEFVRNLMEDVILIDATLLFHNNKWWMFGCSQNHPVTSTNDQLMLYYSDDLLSNNWIPHRQNPIVTDISNCRPAGKIFKQNDCLYRPAQNNASHQYGYGIKLNKIIVLNENEYKEECIREIDPITHNGFSAIHTLNFEGELSVIDGIQNKNPA